jgi:hypothetical protein
MAEQVEWPQLKPEPQLKLEDSLRHRLQHEESIDSAVDVADGISLTSESSLGGGSSEILLGDNWSVADSAEEARSEAGDSALGDEVYVVMHSEFET